MLVAQLCLILWGPMDCCPPGSSVLGIFLARMLEWVAVSYSRGSSWLRDWTQSPESPALAGGVLTAGATWEAGRSWPITWAPQRWPIPICLKDIHKLLKYSSALSEMNWHWPSSSVPTCFQKPNYCILSTKEGWNLLSAKQCQLSSRHPV